MKDIEHKLQVYRDRLRNHLEPDMVEFYLNEIERMENEIEADDAVFALMDECRLIPPYKFTTDDVGRVNALLAGTDVVSVKEKWSWKYFKKMYYVEFYYKRR